MSEINHPKDTLITCLYHLAIPFNQPKLCYNASWDASAKTFGNENFNSWGIFVSAANIVYVADQNTPRISVQLGSNGTLIRTISNNLKKPKSVFVSIVGDIYVNHEGSPDTVDKWASNGTKLGTAMKVNANCAGVFIDNNDYLYCSSECKHQVLKKNLSCANCSNVLAAGNGTAGVGSTQLNQPQGIFVDDDLTLYVADSKNSRIQKFERGQSIGKTIFGNSCLKEPSAIVLDADKNLYILDRGNHRVVRLEANIFQCIAGCSGEGSSATQLKSPRGLSFDPYGNLFVADTENRRIQKFTLATNSCGKPNTLSRQ